MSLRVLVRSFSLVLTLSAPVAMAAGAQTTISSSAAAELLYQIETLQREVSELRGLVEQQQYEIGKMKSLQKDRYIDLDKRISDLANQARSSSKSTAPIIQLNEADEGPISTNVSSAPVKAVELASASEEAKKAYSSAYELIKSKDFEGARTAFRTFVEQYPNNVLTGNGHYWLGELALVLGNQGEALVQFKTVIDSFPGHGKVADATYKMGIVNDQIGNQTLAKEYFQRTIERYRDSNAAKLATNYLKNMK